MSEAKLIYNEMTGRFETNIGSVSDPLVTTAQTQTLTNKTLTAPTLTAVAITGTSTIGAGMTLTSPTINSPVFSKSYTRQLGGPAKVGTSAGWVLSAANNLPYLATMAASQTGGTLVIKLDGLQIGATITGFKVIAQIESAGGAVTIDADLRAVTNVAAEPTDASIGTMTQISVTADTAAAQAKTGLTEVVTSGKSYYLLLTATTAASTDIILQYPEITVTEI
jgi:hypothetical protein